MSDNLPYAAGLFDGEGYVYLKQRKKTRLSVVVSVTNTNKEVLDQIKVWFGGSVRPRSNSNVRAKASWLWRTSDKNAMTFLRAIYPWLIIKRRQTELAFKCKSLAPGPGKRWSPETMRELTDQMHDLNRRGVVA